jgi:hypothetical protein
MPNKMAQSFGDLRFRFMPCGYKPRDFDGMVYVKYKHASKHSYDSSTSIISLDNNHIHYDMPDRELLFTANGYSIGGDRPFNKPLSGDNWHSAISMSVASSVADDLPFDRYMINPHAFTPNTEPKLRDKNNVYTSDKVIMSDSGGFQLGHGAMNFIHPGELSEFFMRNVDEGVVLDLPARQLGDSDILKHTAKIQNMNTKYMKNILPKSFRLSTVAHGLSLQKVDQFRQQIEDFDADFPIICISGTLRFNLLEGLHRILHIIESGAEYEQYHVLGVSNPPFYAALIRAAYILKQKGINVLITADSSSPIAFSLKHTYYSQPAFYNGLNPVRFGNKMSSNTDTPAAAYPNPHRKFGSSDPFTQVIGGYQDTLSLFNITTTQSYIMYMNQMELVRYVNQMCLHANDLSYLEYKALVNEQYKSSNHRHILGVAIDYLNTYLEYDLKTAYEKYKFYMPSFSGERTLHTFPSMISSASELEQEAEFSVKKSHLVKVIRGYYEFHATGKVPERMNPDHKKQSAKNGLVVKI